MAVWASRCPSFTTYPTTICPQSEKTKITAKSMLPPEEGNHWQRSPEPLFRFMGEDPLLCKAICEDWQRCLHGVMFIDQHRASTENQAKMF